MNQHFWTGFEKRAWDGDYEEDGKYFINANRTAGPIGMDVVGDLKKVVKHGKGLEVRVFDGREHKGNDVLKALDNIENHVKHTYNNGKDYKASKNNPNMNWDRSFTWSIGVPLSEANSSEIIMDNPNRGFFDKLLGRNKTKTYVKHDAYDIIRNRAAEALKRANGKKK